MARSGNGQDLNKIIISIELKNASLKEAIKKIESLTQLAFTYRTADVAEVDHINYQASKNFSYQYTEWSAASDRFAIRPGEWEYCY